MLHPGLTSHPWSPDTLKLMPARLTAEELNAKLMELDGWSTSEGEAIAKTFTFGGFGEAMRFVHKVADVANRSDHHPDIDIRWNKVRLVLTTHSAGGLTAMDFRVAAQIDDIAA